MLNFIKHNRKLFNAGKMKVDRVEKFNELLANYDIVQSRDIVEEEGFLREKHLIDAEYEDRPLSKLTKDILDLLGIRRG